VKVAKCGCVRVCWTTSRVTTSRVTTSRVTTSRVMTHKTSTVFLCAHRCIESCMQADAALAEVNITSALKDEQIVVRTCDDVRSDHKHHDHPAAPLVHIFEMSTSSTTAYVTYNYVFADNSVHLFSSQIHTRRQLFSEFLDCWHNNYNCIRVQNMTVRLSTQCRRAV